MKIIHTADQHLAYRQYGFAQREEDFLNAFRHVIKRGIDLKADVIVIAGDLFDIPKPPAYIVQAVCEAVAHARAAEIDVIGIDGNHDVADGNWLKVCGIQNLVEVPYKTIVGLPYLRPAVFKERLKKMADDGVQAQVFVMHQAVAEMADFAAQEITLMEIAPWLNKMGVKYVAMGDIHNYKEMEFAGIRFAYSGSTEVNATDERRDKSFSIIDIDQNTGKMSTATEPIPIRPIVERYLQSEKDLDELLVQCAGNPLVILWYDSEKSDLAKRAEALLLDKQILHRICPTTAKGLNTIAAQLNRAQLERKGALVRLREAIGAFFEENSDEHELILQLLNTPDAVENTVKQYMTSKGVTVWAA